MKTTTYSATETSRLAKSIAKKAKPKKEGAFVFGLVGDLGAGKTAFVRSFIRTLGVKERVASPTFLIMRSFNIPKGSFNRVYHIDAYRIKSRDLLKLGLRDILKDSENVVLVEWADRVKSVLPKNTKWINFSHGKNKNERHIKH